MILKLKYIGIILISIGFVLNGFDLLGFGIPILNLGAIAFSIYCISKIIYSDTYLLKVKFLSTLLISVGLVFQFEYIKYGVLITTIGLIPLSIYCIAKLLGK
tara:strand:+ start:90 stop:395 length:306 start_codon:yes stop_codon:yes gene_type:complete